MGGLRDRYAHVTPEFGHKASKPTLRCSPREGSGGATGPTGSAPARRLRSGREGDGVSPAQLLQEMVRISPTQPQPSSSSRITSEKSVVSCERLIGVITDRDIAVRAVASMRGPETSVRDVMSSEVKYCFEDESVEDVARNMGDIQVRRLPVLNRNKRLVGIISLGDLALRSDRRAGEALRGISAPGGQHSQSPSAH